MISDLFSFKWYKEQFSGWSNLSYISLLLGIGFIMGATLQAQINIDTIITMFASILGYTSVSAIVNQSRVNGILGLLSAILYIYLAWIAHNPSDAILNVGFILLLDLPVLFKRDWGSVGGVSTLNRNNVWIFIVTFIVTFLIFLQVIEPTFNSSRTLERWLLDSFTASLGYTASVMTVFKVNKAFYVWAFQNVLQVILWGYTAYVGDASWVLMFTYVFYTINSLVAFTSTTYWKLDKKKGL